MNYLKTQNVIAPEYSKSVEGIIDQIFWHTVASAITCTSETGTFPSKDRMTKLAETLKKRNLYFNYCPVLVSSPLSSSIDCFQSFKILYPHIREFVLFKINLDSLVLIVGEVSLSTIAQSI